MDSFQGSSRRKVVLVGHPLVGKTTVIGALAKLKGADLRIITVTTPDSVVDRGVLASWNEGDRHFEVATLSGAVWDRDSWRSLSTPPHTEYIFLLDAQTTLQTRSIFELLKLMRIGIAPLAAVQITKLDLCSAGVDCLDYQNLLVGLSQAGIPAYTSRHDQPRTLVEACCYVLGCSRPSSAGNGVVRKLFGRRSSSGAQK